MDYLSTEELLRVSGGINWRTVARRGAEDGAVGWAAGVAVGGTLGWFAAGPAGALGYGFTGGGIGATTGFAIGAGKAIYDTWNE